MTLIVEDDPIFSDLCEELLQVRGYQTTTVTEGWEAMKVVASKNRPDLILMDLQLPDITGIETAGMLKKSTTHSSIPIIAMTAFRDRWNEEACYEVGCDDYIPKPISVPRFLEKVAEHLS